MSLALWIIISYSFCLHFCVALSKTMTSRTESLNGDRKTQNPYWILVLPILLPVVGLLWSDSAGFLDRYGYKKALSIHGERKAPAQIAIVGFDDEAKELFGKAGDLYPGQWYVPRNTVGQLLNKLADAGAASAFLHFPFVYGDEGRHEDKILLEAMKRIKVFLYADARSAEPYSNPIQGVVTPTEISLPDEEYKKLAAGVVYAGETSDDDTDLLPLLRNKDSSLYGTLPIAESIARVVTNDVYSNFLAYGTHNKFYLNYYGTLGKGFDFYSAAALTTMSPEELKNKFENKIVLLGYRSYFFYGGLAEKELIEAIKSFRMYDIDLQATAAANLIDRSYIREVPRRYSFWIIIGFVLLLSWFLLNAPRRIFARISVAALSAVIWLPVLGYYLLTQHYVLFPFLTLAWVVLPFVVTACLEFRCLEHYEISVGAQKKETAS